MAVIYINVFLFEKSILPACVRNIIKRGRLAVICLSLPIRRVSGSIKVRWHLYEYTGASLHL